MTDSNTGVTKRRVFHIPGYDPIHPRRYRELYRSESKVQAEISGYEIGIAAKTNGDEFGWNVGARIDGADVVAKVEVLVWSDIVRDSMKNTIPATYLQLLQTAWIYITSGTLRRLMWMRKGPVIAALYPVGMLLLQLFGALLAGWMLGTMIVGALLWVANIVGLASLTAGFPDVVIAVAGYIIALMKYAIWAFVAVYLLRWFKSLDGKLYAYYLMHDYAYSAKLRGAYPPELEDRMAQFVDTIAQALKTNVDEVLIVGHSSGAHLAISILADLIRDGRVPDEGAKLSFLSLGQVVPMVSFLPKAQRLRTDLAYLTVQDAVTWVDVSAPGDGCCFALCDPVSVTGVTPPGKKCPLIMSAAFTQSLSEERWEELRWRFFRLHFQYLCAFDRPRDYDYFQITAGPVLLRERYKDRPPSKSRIDVAVSNIARS